MLRGHLGDVLELKAAPKAGVSGFFALESRSAHPGDLSWVASLILQGFPSLHWLQSNLQQITDLFFRQSKSRV